MEYTVHLNSLNTIDEFLELNIQYYVVGANQFSCRQSLSLDYQELKLLKKKLSNKKLYVLCNALVEECNLENAKKHLNELSSIGIDGLLFQDLGILQEVNSQKYKFDMIYSPDTLNTNYATLQVLQRKGVSTAFLAREIPLAEKMHINKQLPTMGTMIQIHGVEYMAYSKRQLLTNYFVENDMQITTGINDNISIRANGVDSDCHIYEDQYGTHITSTQHLYTLDILEELESFNYGYIESLYMSERMLVDIVKLYVLKGNVNEMKALNSDIEYTRSFLFDQTVYTLEDIRKREANESN